MPKDVGKFNFYTSVEGMMQLYGRPYYCPRTRSTPSNGLILRWTLAGSRRS